MSNGAHSKLAPSAAHRWAYCTASVNFVESLNLPAEDSPYAKEGTLAHDTFYTALGMDNPYEVKYRTPEEKEYLPIAIEYVLNLLRLYPECRMHREVRVNPAKFVKTRHCKGTADVIIVTQDALFVIDLKFGEHIAVDVIDNLQLILYALGALAENEDVEEIVLVILQPRAYHPDGPVREWRLTKKELLSYAKFLARRSAEALVHGHFRPDPETVCRFCPAQGVCRALAHRHLRTARETFTSIEDEGVPYKDYKILTAGELATILDELPAMSRWISEVRGYALQYLRSGGKLPRYGYTAKYGNRSWAADKELLEIMFGEEVLYEQKIRSPAQVEKLVGKHSVDNFVERVVTGYALCEEANDADETQKTVIFENLDNGKTD